MGVTSHYTEIINSCGMTYSVAVVINREEGLEVFFEPLSKCSWGFSNILLITIHHVTFESVYQPTFLVIGSLFLGAIRSIPCVPHAFLKLSLRHLMYGTAMYVFLLEPVVMLFCWLAPLLLLLFSGFGWVLFLIFILFKDHMGQLHLSNNFVDHKKKIIL